MRKNFKKHIFGVLLTLIMSQITAQEIYVDINLNIVHTVGDVNTFERSKYMTLHSSQSENDFLGHLDLMDSVINGLDVYMGREVGAQSSNLNNTNEDPLRAGYGDTTYMKSLGASYKSAYAAKTYVHQYEVKNIANISTHGVGFPFYPIGIKNQKGWAFANSDATAEWLAYYIKYFYGDGGQPTPKYFSIINEPEFINITPFSDLADYHNVIANKVRPMNPDVMIGGFTSAGSQFENKADAQVRESDSNPGFYDWEKQWKTFIDIAGDNMDYFDVHWYDSPFTGYQYLREGANLEASFDMLEQYSKLKLGTVKPFLVSEYGSFIAGYEDEPYTKKRDWTNIKAFSAMLMNYLDRPNLIIKSVPFMIVEGAWGTNPETGYPHPYRLLRQENGKWVFTEFIKFFQLWSDVKGTRVFSNPSDLDIQMETYVDGNKAYVILNNLYFETKTINLNLIDYNNNPLENIKIKHLYLGDDAPELEITNYSTFINTVDIHSEATMVLEYTFANTIESKQDLVETKYYADSYLKPIVAAQSVSFNINNVSVDSAYGEAVLRVSFGRDHGASLKPKVSINGTELIVPDNYRGYNMRPRFRWFGALEIPVDYSLLNTNNTIAVEFDDNGGHVSTVTMQVYESNEKVITSEDVSSIELHPKTMLVGVNQVRHITEIVYPKTAIERGVLWKSLDSNIASVTDSGIVTGKSIGITKIIATTIDGGVTDTCDVTVQTDIADIFVDTIIIEPSLAKIYNDSILQLSPFLFPVDADDTFLIWSSSDENVAKVDNNGTVNAVSAGIVKIKATAINGNYGIMEITVLDRIYGAVTFDDTSKYLNTDYVTGGTLPVNCSFIASSDQVTDGNGIKFALKELDEKGVSVLEKTNLDQSARDKVSGTATGSILLRNITPSSELAVGHYYILSVSFNEKYSKKNVENVIYPINIVNATGIYETELHSINIYPNPANNILNIEGVVNDDIVDIYNIHGAFVSQKIVADSSIDISDLNNGIYLLKFVGVNYIQTLKLTITH